MAESVCARFRRLALVAAALAIGAGPLRAQTFPASDQTAGYIVFPKVHVSIDGVPGNPQIDTLIQITNTSLIGNRIVHCSYTDIDTCQEIANFEIELTPNQPIAWRVSEGLSRPLIPARGPTYIGELKCVETNSVVTPVPVAANDLKGEATIYTVASGTAGSVDIRSYNAIGFQALNASAAEPPAAINRKCLGGTNPGTVCTLDSSCMGGGVCGVVLCLGATTGSAECTTATHVGCPHTIILNNFFDGAQSPVTGKQITTRLTLVSCSEDLNGAVIEDPVQTRVQFLVFNEFEQRMSTAAIIDCFRDVQLSNIDSLSGAEAASVFNVAVQGTLAGQVRMRAVLGQETDNGHGILAIAEETHGAATVAVNLNEVGINSDKGDFVRYLP